MSEQPHELDRTVPVLPSSTAGERPASGSVAQLLVLEGPRRGELIEWPEGGALRVGRRDDNEVVLPTADVSKHHATFAVDGKSCHVEDVGSTNGVFVNGTRLPIDVRRRLSHGDNVRITKHLFLFRQQGCFHDASGASTIQLDTQKIAADVDAFLAEIGGLPGR